VPYAFVCTACGLVLDDGVDYTWCPKCTSAVQRIAAQPSVQRPSLPTVGVVARWLLGAFLVLQAILALLAPDAFPYLAAWLFIVQLAGLGVVVLAVMLSPDLRALARNKRTRILHGLEHATINLMLQRGFPVRSGCTYDGEFVIRIDHDGRSWNRLLEIRDIARDAIIRIVRGERELAYTPECGTSWLVGYCLLALAIVGSGLVGRMLGAPVGVVFAASVGAAICARAVKRPLGLWVQRHVSVSTDVLVASIKDMQPSVSSDGNTMIVTIAMDVTPKIRASRGGTVTPLFG
jgi:hypothetical protein